MTYFSLGKIHHQGLIDVRYLSSGLVSFDEISECAKGEEVNSPPSRTQSLTRQMIEEKARKLAELKQGPNKAIIIVGPHRVTNIEDLIALYGKEELVMKQGDVWGFDVLGYEFADKSATFGSSIPYWNTLPDADNSNLGGNSQFFGIPLTFSILFRASYIDEGMIQGSRVEYVRDIVFRELWSHFTNKDRANAFRCKAFNYLCIGPIQHMGEPNLGINASDKNGYRFCYLPYVLHQPREMRVE